MLGFPSSSSSYSPPFYMVCLSGLHPKRKSPRSVLPSPAVITACQKGTMENRAQDTSRTDSIRQKRKQRSTGGRVRRWLLHLSIQRSSKSSIFGFKNACICYGLCASTPAPAYVGRGRLVHSINKHARPTSLLNTGLGTRNTNRRLKPTSTSSRVSRRADA